MLPTRTPATTREYRLMTTSFWQNGRRARVEPLSIKRSKRSSDGLIRASSVSPGRPPSASRRDAGSSRSSRTTVSRAASSSSEERKPSRRPPCPRRRGAASTLGSERSAQARSGVGVWFCAVQGSWAVEWSQHRRLASSRGGGPGPGKGPCARDDAGDKPGHWLRQRQSPLRGGRLTTVRRLASGSNDEKREITASETQPTAVLRASNAVVALPHGTPMPRWATLRSPCVKSK